MLSPELDNHYPPPSHHEPAPEAASSHAHAVPPNHTHAVEALVPSLVSETVEMFDADATAVQRDTVQAHLEDIYTPGYPASPAELGRTRSPRRQAPQRDGFGCTIEGCTKRYDRACDLNRHLKIHLGGRERPHQCAFCNEGFLYPKDLIRHQRKHKEESLAQTNFYCPVGGCRNTKGFSRHDNLLRHRRSKHGSIRS